MPNAGGSRGNSASILTRLHALAEAEQQLATHSAALHQAQAALHSMAAAAATHNRCCTTTSSSPMTLVEQTGGHRGNLSAYSVH